MYTVKAQATSKPPVKACVDCNAATPMTQSLVNAIFHINARNRALDRLFAPFPQPYINYPTLPHGFPTPVRDQLDYQTHTRISTSNKHAGFHILPPLQHPPVHHLLLILSPSPASDPESSSDHESAPAKKHRLALDRQVSFSLSFLSKTWCTNCVSVYATTLSRKHAGQVLETLKHLDSSINAQAETYEYALLSCKLKRRALSLNSLYAPTVLTETVLLSSNSSKLRGLAYRYKHWQRVSRS
jgi:hypothetical protein